MSLTFSETEALFARMLDGELSDDEIRDTLIEMSDRGETSEEIAGAAKAMRDRMSCVTAPRGAIDVCGTGGDGHHSLNISAPSRQVSASPATSNAPAALSSTASR